MDFVIKKMYYWFPKESQQESMQIKSFSFTYENKQIAHKKNISL